MNLRVVDDPAREAAERIAAVVRSGGGHIALAGGSTPRAAYERVAAMDLDWSSTTLWFGDERCVPPEDERSNYGMAKVALLDRLDDPGPDVKRIQGELGHSDAAAEYEWELHAAFHGSLPRMDLTLLGIGPDMHTASLFPGTPAVDEERRPAVGVPEPGLEPKVPRVTLTVPSLNNSKAVAFLIAGEDKADAVAGAFGGPGRREAPSSLVRPHDGELELILDAGAASKLQEARS